MKKRYQTFFWLVFLPVLLLVACGGSTAEPPAQPPESAVQPVESEPVQQAVPTEVPPTAEAEIMPVAAKPQLIEFYADW